MQPTNERQTLPAYTVHASGARRSRLIADNPASRQSVTRADRADLLSGLFWITTCLGGVGCAMAVAAVLVGWFDTWQSGNLLNPFGHPSISLWGYVAETPGLLGLRWAVALACLVAFTLIAFILTCSFAHLERREGRTNNGCFEVPWSPAELEKLPLIDGRRAPDVLFAAGRADMLGEATHRVERAEHEARVAWATQELADAARRATPAPTLDDIINSVPSATRAGIYGKEQS